MADLTLKATQSQVADLMRQLIAGLGGAGDPYGINSGIQLRMGSVLLSKIQQDFTVKAQGGTGEDGITWPDLKPETKAYGRRHTQTEYKQLMGDVKFYRGKENKQGVSKQLGARVWDRSGRKITSTAPASRPTLTKAQDEIWRRVYAQTMGMLMAKFGTPNHAAAAGAAWNAAKAAGAKTKLGTWGQEKVDILIDKGLLFRSFSPGMPGNINRAEPGRVVVGTREKPWHHFGGAKLPERNFWPRDGQIPAKWWESIILEGRRGIAEAAVRIFAKLAG
jgi:hypothetical protein